VSIRPVFREEPKPRNGVTSPVRREVSMRLYAPEFAALAGITFSFVLILMIAFS
jgi:hypothetical protein